MIGLILPVLARMGVSARFRGVLAWMIALAAVAALCGLLWWAAASWINGEREEAVKLDRSDVTIAAANMVIAADRAAEANQAAADAAFANEQDQAEDKIDEAERTRTSPLDALFNELR